MPKLLKSTHFGNTVLRQVARRLSKKEILSGEIQKLIADMRYTIEKRKMGVGLAAPQVGQSVAMSIIAIKPTPNRPDIKRFEQVIINPVVIETYGRKYPQWEGCMSAGTANNTLFALVPRYKKVKLRFYNEKAMLREEILEGLAAHVAQHETDHLNGILFVDKVKNPKTYTMAGELRKILRAEKKASKA